MQDSKARVIYNAVRFTKPFYSTHRKFPLDFKLTDEQSMIQAAAQDFAREEIVPVAAEFDRSGAFPSDTIAMMGELGLMGVEVPEN